MTVPQAVRAIVAATPGEPITMTLYDGTGALAEISLGPADAVALAGDLIERARSGYGRPISAPAFATSRARLWAKLWDTKKTKA